jgi:hypothetical protein
MTLPRIFIRPMGGSQFEGYPLPSSRLGSFFSRCAPAATNVKVYAEHYVACAAACRGGITYDVFKNLRTLYVIQKKDCFSSAASMTSIEHHPLGFPSLIRDAPYGRLSRPVVAYEDGCSMPPHPRGVTLLNMIITICPVNWSSWVLPAKDKSAYQRC